MNMFHPFLFHCQRTATNPRWPEATQGDRRPPTRETSDYVVTESYTFLAVLCKRIYVLYLGTILGYPWIASIVFIWKKHPKACKVTFWLDLSTIHGDTWLVLVMILCSEDVFSIAIQFGITRFKSQLTTEPKSPLRYQRSHSKSL